MLWTALIISIILNLYLFISLRKFSKPKMKDYVKLISLSSTAVAIVDALGTTIDHIGFTNPRDRDFYKSKLHNKWCEKYNIEVIVEQETEIKQITDDKKRAWIVDTSNRGVALVDENNEIVDRIGFEYEWEREPCKQKLHKNWSKAYSIQLKK